VTFGDGVQWTMSTVGDGDVVPGRGDDRIGRPEPCDGPPG